MAHQEQVDFCLSVKDRYSDFFKNANVIDIGSLDINGNNRYLFENCNYTGVDIGAGRNVDVVSKGHEYTPNEKVDFVISTECFEHDQYWDKTIHNIVENMLKNGGMFLFTCATTGRPEHGTRRADAGCSPFTAQTNGWEDYYQNLTEEDIRKAIDVDAYFKDYQFSVNPISCDIYFWGIKK
jgi:hypothetical protein